MKKNLFYLFALICSMSLFTACSDDDDEVKSLPEVNAPYVSSELELTYGGEVLLGKKVTFYTADGKSADITLEGADIALTKETMASGLVNPGVIPGEPKVTFSAALQPAEGGYTFAGEHVADNYSMKYEGAVEKGKLDLALEVKLAGDNALAGNTWNLFSYDPYAVKNPLHVVWNSEKPFSVVLFPLPGAQPVELQPGEFITLMSAMGIIPVGDKKMGVNEILSCLLQSVTFREDGNIVASYSDVADIVSPKFQNSPLNMVQYAVKNEKLYLYLNVDAIIGAVQKMTTKGLDMETVLPVVLPKLMELIPMLSSGIPLGYSVNEEGNELAVYIDKELGSKLIDILLSLLENEEIVAAIKEAATSNPDFAMFAGVVEAILEQAPEVFAKTNEMELGLNFVK
ncbi:DUF4925 domain-containing protein [uncultured Bacteroides sp.]|uniref:DUF4925 domain-containing protein n=1 Tax=uncultured Bacteroides sp. TaxID=162156 RepID=UPI0025997068|nr:DUF4925 domain-containing protein [uncultured Bacteroides sp.]